MLAHQRESLKQGQIFRAHIWRYLPFMPEWLAKHCVSDRAVVETADRDVMPPVWDTLFPKPRVISLYFFRCLHEVVLLNCSGAGNQIHRRPVQAIEPWRRFSVHLGRTGLFWK